MSSSLIQLATAGMWALAAVFVLSVTLLFGTLPRAIPLYLAGGAFALLAALIAFRTGVAVVLCSLIGGLLLVGVAILDRAQNPINTTGPFGVALYGLGIVAASTALLWRRRRGTDS
jgi:hypothetical protein